MFIHILWFRSMGFWLALFLCLGAPFVSFAWMPGDNIIPCGFTSGDECGFADFVTLLGNVIDVLLWFATVLAAIAFAYAGFLYATSAGNPGKVSSAHRIFGKVAVGFIVALSAWLIIKTIEIALLGSDTPSFLR